MNISSNEEKDATILELRNTVAALQQEKLELSAKLLAAEATTLEQKRRYKAIIQKMLDNPVFPKCPICLRDGKANYNSGHCPHLLCGSCIQRVTSLPSAQRKCPICRTQMSRNRYHRICL